MGLTGSILDQLDQIGDWGLLATDTDLVVTRWNRWLEQRSGRAAADVVGRPLAEVVPGRMERYYRQALGGQTVILSQRLHKYVVPLPAPEGAGYAHLQQTSRIVPLVDGPVVCGTLTLIEDVTERVAYEAELRARARQQTAVAAVARSALGGQDTAELAREVVGHVHETFDADYVEILELRPDGRTWARLAGAGWGERPAPEAAGPARARLVRAADGPGAVTNLTPDLIAADPDLRAAGVADGLIAAIPGRERPFGLLGVYTRSPRRFPPGEHLFAQALADTLGAAVARERLEVELRARVRDLAEADQRKDEFLAMLAHELRNPLAPVRTGLQVLQLKGAGNPDAARLTDMMGRQVAQIARLVDDLLDVSRITRGTVALRKTTTDLAAVVGQAVEAARPLIDARRHVLTVTLPPEPIHLDADPARLAQVVGNLLNNAVKYTEEGGRSWLEGRREGGVAVVTVRDAGAGIPAEMLPRVFDLFTQVDRTLDRSQGGLGVGLTLVRSLVELHGGTVTAASAGPGRGSEFVVRLPALSSAAPSHAPPPLTRTPGSIPPRRVLIVDDNVDAADSLAVLLRLSGHQVWTAYGGPSAIAEAEKRQPEVILLDIGLPVMDGYEVARRLRLAPAATDFTLIALTGYGQDDDRRKTRDAGFDYHFVKPVDPADLATILSRSRS